MDFFSARMLGAQTNSSPLIGGWVVQRVNRKTRFLGRREPKGLQGLILGVETTTGRCILAMGSGSFRLATVLDV